MPPPLSILKIGSESKEVLGNLFQYYLRDMAEWFEVEIAPDGSYVYDVASVWEKGYEAYLAKAGDSVVGFALVGSAREWLGETGADGDAHDVHEFFVVREFRRGGVGQRLAVHIWNPHPGEWLVRVLEVNAPALAFWRAAIAAYTHGNRKEERRVVNGRPWVFFQFTAQGPLGPSPEL
jgi:predicted acetyltransferase